MDRHLLRRGDELLDRAFAPAGRVVDDVTLGEAAQPIELEDRGDGRSAVEPRARLQHRQPLLVSVALIDQADDRAGEGVVVRALAHHAEAELERCLGLLLAREGVDHRRRQQQGPAREVLVTEDVDDRRVAARLLDLRRLHCLLPGSVQGIQLQRTRELDEIGRQRRGPSGVSGQRGAETIPLAPPARQCRGASSRISTARLAAITRRGGRSAC